MKQVIKTNNGNYELIKNYRSAYKKEEFLYLFTDFFYDYDYIVGDIAYSKLRLKGFYDHNNKKVKKINDYKDVDKYLKEKCASDCKHFILKKEGSNK
jgi:uncharacterized protein YutD